jgi:hypothetical protein
MRSSCTSRELGHHHVEDDQVRTEVAGQADGAERVVERPDGVARLLEFIIQELGDVGFVVDDQDALEMFGVHGCVLT